MVTVNCKSYKPASKVQTHTCVSLAEEGLGRRRLERSAVHLGRLDDAVRKRELDLSVVELLDVRPLALSRLQLGRLQDLNAGGLSAAETSHVLVQRVDGVRQRDLAVLLVGVVRAGPRVVPEPDANVLDLLRRLLEDLVDRDDLAIGLLHAAQAADEVPEARAGNDLVLSEDLHAVDLALRVRLAILGVRHKPTTTWYSDCPVGRTESRFPIANLRTRGTNVTRA